jgi:DnaJ family protein C protein 17
MPSSSFTGKDGMPLKDPYRILGISHTATEADVKKAYRQLALKLHPDKQSGRVQGTQREDLENRFHDVKDARSFLLDAEHADGRRRYDANLASERARHAVEERRERTMSTRRKRMREELISRERMAARTTGGETSSSSATGGGGPDRRFDVDRLRREGERLRAEYAAREADADASRRRREATERASLRLSTEDRQVRLKWSRKRVPGGVGNHDKSSIMRVVEAFGTVEDVEMIGSKGNAALVTFADGSSCGPCVEAYRSSEDMRATFVGRRRVDDVAAGGGSSAADVADDVDFLPSSRGSGRDADGLRREAERERLMRRMELEEAGFVAGGDDDAVGGDDRAPRGAAAADAGADRWGRGQQQRKSNFPPDFPAVTENEGLSPFQLLEKYEQIILRC